MAMAGPRFFGFVIGGSLPVTLAANWLAGAWDQNAAYYNSTPSAAVIEQTALRWLLDLLGLPGRSGGAFVTGATMANFTALAAARHAVLEPRRLERRSGRSVWSAADHRDRRGRGARLGLSKPWAMLGLGRNRVIKVPVDGQGRMRADALPDISGPTIVCMQAGNVNTGAFDPFRRSSARAHDAGAWVHVDGAFGLWARRAPTGEYLTAGLLEADSWATDAHKWLNVPYDSGLAFVRDPHAPGAMAITAEYLPPPALTAIRPTSPPSCRGARAAWKCGPPCAPWDARAWPI